MTGLNLSPPAEGYFLADSGNLSRIEKFGEYILERPSSLAIWERRARDHFQPQAVYTPPGSWRMVDRIPESWPITIAGVTMLLRCQSNGQVGLFPEHATYLDNIRTAASNRPGLRMLNLFAYTGLASLVAATAGAEVTHVDLSKSAISWARENAIENNISSIRFITEDALTFLEREAKRGNTYGLILADPPSFSRPGPRSTWQLQDIIIPLLTSMIRVLSPGGMLYVASHNYELGNVVLQNLLYGLCGSKLNPLCSRQLIIPEHNSPFALPAGFVLGAELLP